MYFEHSCDALLKPINPMPKFWSIKLIVFATFWQGLIINHTVPGSWFDKIIPWAALYEECCVPYLTTRDDGNNGLTQPTDNPPSFCHPWCDETDTNDFVASGVHKICALTSAADTSSLQNQTYCDASNHICGCPREEDGGSPSHCACGIENSICLSTYRDDIGNLNKFSAMSVIQLQNFIICEAHRPPASPPLDS